MSKRPKRAARSRTKGAPFFASFSRGVILFACAAIPLIVAGALGRALWESDAFYVKQIDVVGLQSLSRNEVLAAALLDQPTSVLDCSPERIATRLIEHPWIVDAQVAATWNGLVHIEITEAQASALVAGSNGIFLAGVDGTPIRAMESTDLDHYPLLTGVPFVAESDHYDPQVLREGMEIFTSFVALGEAFPVPRELQYDPVYGWRAVLADGAEIAIGQAPFARRVHRVGEVYSTLQAQGLAAARVSVDTSSLRQVAVALRSPVGEEQ